MTLASVITLINQALADFRRCGGVGTARTCSGEVIVSLEITETNARSRKYAISVKANKATRQMVAEVLDNEAIKDLINAATAAAKEQAK